MKKAFSIALFFAFFLQFSVSENKDSQKLYEECFNGFDEVVENAVSIMNDAGFPKFLSRSVIKKLDFELKNEYEHHKKSVIKYGELCAEEAKLDILSDLSYELEKLGLSLTFRLNKNGKAEYTITESRVSPEFSSETRLSPLIQKGVQESRKIRVR